MMVHNTWMEKVMFVELRDDDEVVDIKFQMQRRIKDDTYFS
jgi:hypothetical protein